MGIQYRTQEGHWDRTRGERGLDIRFNENRYSSYDSKASLKFWYFDELAFEIYGTTVPEMIIEILHNASWQHREAIKGYLDDLIEGKIKGKK